MNVTERIESHHLLSNLHNYHLTTTTLLDGFPQAALTAFSPQTKINFPRLGLKPSICQSKESQNQKEPKPCMAACLCYTKEFDGWLECAQLKLNEEQIKLVDDYFPHVIIYPGKNRDGYWNIKQLVKQVIIVFI